MIGWGGGSRSSSSRRSESKPDKPKPDPPKPDPKGWSIDKKEKGISYGFDNGVKVTGTADLGKKEVGVKVTIPFKGRKKRDLAEATQEELESYIATAQRVDKK